MRNHSARFRRTVLAAAVAVGMLSQSSCAKEENSTFPSEDPFEKVLSAFRNSRATGPAPFEISAALEREDGVDYLRFFIRNLSESAFEIESTAFPWAGPEAAPNFAGMTRWDLNHPGPDYIRYLGRNPVEEYQSATLISHPGNSYLRVIEPGQTIEGRMRIPDLVEPAADFGPAPTDQAIDLYWSTSFAGYPYAGWVRIPAREGSLSEALSP